MHFTIAGVILADIDKYAILYSRRCIYLYLLLFVYFVQISSNFYLCDTDYLTITSTDLQIDLPEKKVQVDGCLYKFSCFKSSIST